MSTEEEALQTAEDANTRLHLSLLPLFSPI
jgi:hypothetical protein